MSPLKPVIERDPRAQVAHLYVYVRTGSLADSDAALPGLASFTARALLRGTRSRPYRELIAAIERLGASVAVRSNQTVTTLSASVLVRNFDPFLEILREMLSEPAFDPAEMDKLRTTLQGELRASLQDPQELATQAALRAAYAGTAAEHPPEGTIEGISRITPRDLSGFFRKHYVQGNLVVGLATPLEEESAMERLTRVFSGIPEGASTARHMPDPTFREGKAVIVHREDLSTTPAYVVARGASDADPDLPALELGNFVFGGDFTSRLMQFLRAENGWTYGVSSSFRELVTQKDRPGLFSVYLFPSAEHAERALAATLEMLGKYVREGVTDEEFQQARDALVNSYAFQVATAEQRLALRLRQILTGRKMESPDEYARRLASLDTGLLNQLIARKHPSDPLLIVTVGDVSRLRPILAALPGIKSVEGIELENE